MTKKTGPFQLFGDEAKSSDSSPSTIRNYSCQNYETCLNLAAALNWDSFTCSGCSGDINETLYWRAHQEMKKDNMVKMICDLPEIGELEDHGITPLLQVGGKR